jgi:hypothetical protein
MNKHWFQFIDGEKVDWPDNELPHPKTIFKADFINQFIGWCKYLQHISPSIWGANGSARDISFIEVGTIIQEASFWNRLIVNPYDAGYYLPLWAARWAWGLTAAELKDVGTSPKLSSLYKPQDNPEWADHPVEPFARGDNLQGNLRQWIFNLRWRIDNTTACYGGHSHAASSSMTIKQWSGRLDGTDRTVQTWQYDDEMWIIPTLDARTSIYYSHEYGRGHVFSDISISSTPHADASLLVNWAGSGSTPHINFPTPNSTEFHVLATARPPGTMYSGAIPAETMPLWGCGDVQWSVDISTVIIPDSDLPAAFTP